MDYNYKGLSLNEMPFHCSHFTRQDTTFKSVLGKAAGSTEDLETFEGL